MKYQGELKIIDTEEKAYFLGQAYGDGYNAIKSPYKFSMASINTDESLYKKLNTLFPFLKLKYYKSHSNMVYLNSSEKSLCLDLQSHGLCSNKTILDKTGEFHFPKIPKHLINHFIRGFFDADGSVWYPKRVRSRNNLHIEISLSTPNFLNSLHNILKKEGIIFNYYKRDKKASNGKYYTSYCIMSSNYNTSIKFADYIYKDATIYLKRKYDICYREKIDINVASNTYGACPYCKSLDIIQNGIRKTKQGVKQRLKCRHCNKNFQSNALLTGNC